MKQLTGGYEIQQRNILEILARRKLLTATVSIAVFTAAVLITFMLPRHYEMRMKILVRNERAQMIVSPDARSSPVYSADVSETRINSEVELLNSTDLLRQVVLDSGLHRAKEAATADASPDLAVDRALRQLLRDLKVVPVRKASIIQVHYTHTNPRMAALVLRRLAERYLDLHIKSHGTPGTVEFFKREAAHHRQVLEDTEHRLSDFRQRENIVLLEQQKITLLQKSADAQSELLAAEASLQEHTDKIADIRSRLNGTNARIVTVSRTIPNQYSVERLHTMVAELQNRRTQLLVKFRPDDRSVLEVEKEIADTEVALQQAAQLNAREETSDINPVYRSYEIELAKEESELAGLTARRQALLGQGRRYREQLTRLGGATMEDEELVRSRKEAEENYLLYSKKAAEAAIAESLDRQKIANVAIVEAPTQPQFPSKPNVPLNLAVGFILALGLGPGAAFIAEYLRETVTERRELESLMGLPVLACVTFPLLAGPRHDGDR